MQAALIAIFDETVRGSPFEGNVLRVLSGKEPIEAFLALYELEVGIGGVGVHNVERVKAPLPRVGTRTTGAYEPEDRQLFRGIQYCVTEFFLDWYDLNARHVVEYAASHVADSLKLLIDARRGSIPRNAPMGPLIKRAVEIGALDSTSIRRLSGINSAYRDAKHTFAPRDEVVGSPEELDLATHMFTFHEALIVYFAGRIVGHSLLDNAHNLGGKPRTYDLLPQVPLEEYLRKIRFTQLAWGRVPDPTPPPNDPFLDSVLRRVTQGPDQ